VSGVGVKVLVVGGPAGVGSVGRGQGLPHARHSQFQQPHGGTDVHTAAHGQPVPEQMDIPEQIVLHRVPTPGQRKNTRGKELQRETAMH